MLCFALAESVADWFYSMSLLSTGTYSPNTVKKFICGNGWATKAEVSRAVVLKYPELKVYLTQDRAWKERFHQNMFDAVALGIMAMRRKCG